MKGYWRIQREWIADWGLTASECIVLADILSGWECPVKERAQRCGMSVRKLEYVMGHLYAHASAKIALQQVQKLHFKGAKIALRKCKNCTSQVQKLHFPPHPPIIEEEEKKEEERENKAHTQEILSNIEKIEKIAAEFREEVAGSTEMSMRLERLFGLPREQLAQAADVFRDTLLAQGDEYKSRGDYRRHFISWLKINAKRIFNECKPNNNARDNADYIGGLIDKLRTGGIG